MTKSKQLQAFEVHKYMRSVNYPGIHAALEQEMKNMDPHGFVQLAKKNYETRTII